MLAGVDVGGTKTHFLVERQDGSRAEQVVETSSWRRGSYVEDALALAELVLAIAEDQPDSTVVGAHGCDSDVDCLRLQGLLSGHLSGLVLTLNDSELLLPAASKAQGVSVIAGTGSIAVTRDSRGQMMSAGGWGWFLGDEGSASGLVRDAARKVRLSLDAGSPIDMLGEALLETIGVQSPVELGRALSGMGSADRIGALAPIVFDAASSGSRLAEEVIAEGGDALARLVEQLARRGAPAEEIVTAGGVISRQERLLEAFRAALAHRVPGSTVTLLGEPPVVGAVMLARRLANGERPQILPFPHKAGLPETHQPGRMA
jgi:glucosamine kinase